MERGSSQRMANIFSVKNEARSSVKKIRGRYGRNEERRESLE